MMLHRTHALLRPFKPSCKGNPYGAARNNISLYHLILSLSSLIFALVLLQSRLVFKHPQWPIISTYTILLFCAGLVFFQGIYLQRLVSICKIAVKDELVMIEEYLNNPKTSVIERKSALCDIRYDQFLLYGPKPVRYTGFISSDKLIADSTEMKRFIFLDGDMPIKHWYPQIRVLCPNEIDVPTDPDKKIEFIGITYFKREYGKIPYKSCEMLVEYSRLIKWKYINQ